MATGPLALRRVVAPDGTVVQVVPPRSAAAAWLVGVAAIAALALAGFFLEQDGRLAGQARLLVICGSGVVIYGARQIHRRGMARAFAQTAQANGWTHEANPDRPDGLDGHALLARGNHQRYSNALHGKLRATPFVAFGFTHGKGTVLGGGAKHHQVIAVRAPHEAPGLEVGPEGWAERFADRWSGKDIDIDDAAFSRRFRIHSPDPAFVRRVFHAGLRQRMMDGWKPVVMSWHGPWLLLARRGTFRPRDIAPLLSDAQAVLAQLSRAEPPKTPIAPVQ